MNVLERMKVNDTERKIADFKVKQQQPYDFKVAYAETRVWEFIRECGKRDLNCHIYGVCPSLEMCIPECKEGYNAQIAEYKRLLKAAVEDLNFESQCRNCKHKEYGLYTVCKECRGNKYEWRYADEALKLIRDSEGDV